MRAEKLKRKRTEYEAQHKEEIARRAREAEARRRVEANIVEQSQLIAHIMARHTTLYDLLQVHDILQSATVICNAGACLSIDQAQYQACSHVWQIASVPHTL